MSRIYFHHLCYQNLTMNKVIYLERVRGEISGQFRKGKLTPSKMKMGTHKDGVDAHRRELPRKEQV